MRRARAAEAERDALAAKLSSVVAHAQTVNSWHDATLSLVTKCARLAEGPDPAEACRQILETITAAMDPPGEEEGPQQTK